MDHYNILTLRNYANQHIYNLISIRNENLTPEEKRLKLQSIFKELVNNIRFITLTDELDIHNIPMAMLFQHLKPTIINLIANCLPKVDKLFIEKGLIYNFDWSIRVFKALQYLGAKDIIIWFFLHVPYYNTTSSSIDKLRDHYYKMLEWLYFSRTMSTLSTVSTKSTKNVRISILPNASPHYSSMSGGFLWTWWTSWT